MCEIQFHPYNPFAQSKSKSLILGSAPPWRFCTDTAKPLENGDIDYYYGSNDNAFWSIMLKVFEPNQNCQLQTKEQIETFLIKHGLAIADILYKFERKNKSSLDKDLSVIDYQNILSLLISNPNIVDIYFTSKKVYDWFKNYVRLHNNLSEEIVGEREDRNFKIEITCKDSQNNFIVNINGHVLFSPSRRGAAGLGNNRRFVKTKKLKQNQNVIYTTVDFRLEDYKDKFKHLA